MPCSYLNPSKKSLDVDRYNYLHRDGKNLIQAWYKKAYDQRECSPKDSFEPFIYLWIAFNAWASCITGIDQDYKLVKKIANCPYLREKFQDFYVNDKNFNSNTNLFADLWPIFRAQDIRRYGNQQQIFLNRDELIAAYYENGEIRFKPSCAKDHSINDANIPRDWPHTLHTIYQIRCNLFHGEKSPHSEMDIYMVKNAFNVLLSFFTKAKLI